MPHVRRHTSRIIIHHPNGHRSYSSGKVGWKLVDNGWAKWEGVRNGIMHLRMKEGWDVRRWKVRKSGGAEVMQLVDF